VSCSCKGFGGFGLDAGTAASMTAQTQQAMAVKLCAMVDPADVALVRSGNAAYETVAKVQAVTDQWVAAFQTMSLADRTAVAQFMILGGCDPASVGTAVTRSVNAPAAPPPSSPVVPLVLAAVAVGAIYLAWRK